MKVGTGSGSDRAILVNLIVTSWRSVATAPGSDFKALTQPSLKGRGPRMFF